MKARRVLVVEDDADTREVLELALSNEGFQVEVAGDLDGVSEVLSSRTPHVILLDYFVDGADVTDFLNVLREHQIQLPIILMTGAAEGPRRAQELGIQFSIVKPFGMDEVIRLLHRAIALRRVGTA